jgi:hypothetical protein
MAWKRVTVEGLESHPKAAANKKRAALGLRAFLRQKQN